LTNKQKLFSILCIILRKVGDTAHGKEKEEKEEVVGN